MAARRRATPFFTACNSAPSSEATTATLPSEEATAAASSPTPISVTPMRGSLSPATPSPFSSEDARCRTFGALDAGEHSSVCAQWSPSTTAQGYRAALQARRSPAFG
ncbi:hypothetical protein PR202_ga13610 [Eleusine coracana subsp. coracana]|uniref:Uncharacterized protein n=1 Tax=Eleusine coracana subsp. coracana TaxID=191504 RepID=A0AAV5CF62_ELECO|nr:hypothetical protein PR202_ga13610 [Eleusine coracana subsp. coracana]